MKRREFIANSAGAAGLLIPGIGRPAVPCPPPQVNAVGGTSASTNCPVAQSYSTNFSGTESAISEGGKWTNGLAVGGLWKNVQTTGGIACGTQTPRAPGFYDDSIACLSGFAANHSAQGTLYKGAGWTGALEAELLLRFSITSGVARGYEVDLYQDRIYLVRWNGALGNFTILINGITTNVNNASGSVFYAQAVGTVITVRCNGNTVLTYDTAGDSTRWSDGNPGVGFYVDTAQGTPGANNNIGWTGFTANNL